MILNGFTSLERRIAELSEIAGLPVLPPNTFNTIPTDMQGSYGRAWSNLLGQDNPTVRVGVRISFPLKNRTAKAELGHSLAEGRRLESVRAQMEQLIEADVRNTIQRVRSRGTR